ncbi:MAG: hypothetical protein DWQ02_23825 [Bacteroidetes bacterium]|nr:MAG: hypothetical protein DWQ02_23825 [Bacteroidota bacterium]
MRNLFLNTLLIVLTLFAFSSCEKEPFNNNKAQWGNSEGRWSDAALDCSGNASKCLPVVIIHGIAAPDNGIVGGLVDGTTGSVSSPFVQDYFGKDEVAQFFVNLNDYQLGLLTSGEYDIKPFFFDQDLYESKRMGRVKFFAAKKEIVSDPNVSLGDYEFNFEVDIRE